MQNDRRKWLLLVGVAVCLGLLIMDKVVLGPATDLWKKRNQRIAQLEKDIAGGERLLKYQKSYDDQWNAMVRNSLPPEQSAAEQLIYNGLSEWSRTGISITRQSPTPKSEKDGSNYIEFRLVGQGSIASIARFLYNVERDPRGLRVQDVTITARDEAGRNLTLELLLSGVVLRGAKNAS
ncbi:hypothetical protein LLG95_02195 [bacterium]|nr:hypothetical protein [bacterium]